MTWQPNITEHPVAWSHRRRRPVEGALIHAMGEFIVVPGKGTFPAADFLERSPELVGSSYSAHRLLAPDGDIIHCVPDTRLAFHAGDSRLGEMIGLNRTFLGLEWLVEGEWHITAFNEGMRKGTIHYSEEQYKSGGWQYASWMRAYDIPRHRIVTHQQVAGDDVRGVGFGKLDPGLGFNHGRLTNYITQFMQPEVEA